MPPPSPGRPSAEVQELARAVRELQRRGVKDAEGRDWLEWLAAQTELLGEADRRTRDPARHDAATLRAYIADLPKGSLRPADEEVKELAVRVRMAQKRGARDAAGKTWAEWLASQVEELSEHERNNRDPLRHSAETLKRFLAAVPDTSEVQALAAEVRQLQRRGACDAEGRTWVAWLAAQTELLSKSDRALMDPARHVAATLRRFIGDVRQRRRAPADERAEEEAKELASIVRRLQKMGATNEQGHGWTDWLASMREELPDRVRSSADPARHSAELLRSFVATFDESVREVLEHRLRRARRSQRSLKDLQELYVAAEKPVADEASCLLELVKLTRAHLRYKDDYGNLPSHEEGWVSAPRRGKGETQEHSLFPPAPTKLLIAIDCEMVATEDDDSALARLCVCDFEGNALLDKLVRPDGRVTDPRTQITGISLADLEATQYTRADAQRDLLALCSKHTVFVGHTLHKDFSSLRFDAPVVADISYLYGLDGLPHRLPALAHLVEQVLGRAGFRGADGQAAHDCIDDVKVTMELFLHRLRHAMALPVVPEVVIVPPPPPQASRAEMRQRPPPEPARTLLAHKVPDWPGALTSLVRLLASTDEDWLLDSIELLECKPTAVASQKVRAVQLVFADAASARAAFEALPPAPAAGGREPPRKRARAAVDSAGRPQKEVELRFPQGDVARIYIRAGVAPSDPLASAMRDLEARQTAQQKPPQARRPEPHESARDAVAPDAAPGRAGGKRQWPGWLAAVDEELAGAPGHALPWRKLRKLVVRRAVGAGCGAEEEAEELGDRALACIPKSYLSREDAFVRLPC